MDWRQYFGWAEQFQKCKCQGKKARWVDDVANMCDVQMWVTAQEYQENPDIIFSKFS